jgi:hypothetical protein
VVAADPTVRYLKLHNGELVYHPSVARGKRYVVAESLRPMIFEYFHDSTLDAHLGMMKILQRISKVFCCPRMRADVIYYVRRCQACQRANPAQNTSVDVHASQVVSKPIEKIFVDFIRPLVRNKKGNVALLVVLDGFSKCVSMYSVRYCGKDTDGKVLHITLCPIMQLCSNLEHFIMPVSHGESNT